MDLIAHIIAPYLQPRDCRALIVAWPRIGKGDSDDDDLSNRVYTDLIMRVGLRPMMMSSPRVTYYTHVFGKYCDFCYLFLPSPTTRAHGEWLLCDECSKRWIHLGNRLSDVEKELNVLSTVSSSLVSNLRGLIHGSDWVEKNELLKIVGHLKHLTERSIYSHKSRLLWRFRGQVYERHVHTVFADELRRSQPTPAGHMSSGDSLCEANVNDPIDCIFACSTLVRAYTATEDILNALEAFDKISQKSVRNTVRIELQGRSITGNGPLHDLAASRPCWEGSCDRSDSCILGPRAWLTNRSRACFLNAVIQALASCADEILPRNIPQGPNGALQREIRRMSSAWNVGKSENSYEDRQVIEEFLFRSHGLSVFTDNDAHEALLYLLNALDPSLSFTSSFVGELRHSRTCSVCGHRYNVLERFSTLSLPPLSTLEYSMTVLSDPQSVQGVNCTSCSLLLCFTALERRIIAMSSFIKGSMYFGVLKHRLCCLMDLIESGGESNLDESWPLEQRLSDGAQGIRTSQIMTSTVSRFPKVLILHIKRTDFRDQTKDRSSIMFTKRLHSTDGSWYNLRSVVIHHGFGWSSGHFSCLRRGLSGQVSPKAVPNWFCNLLRTGVDDIGRTPWYVCDDDRVYRVTLDGDETSSPFYSLPYRDAYLLIYVKEGINAPLSNV
ncbi:hypothetical protein FOL47_009081 [Perkinsus chesapeaki]|uniref:ubiquitinyl hydrolase 1 n=1 Tax=Perkinsus chesapeaki TaxID=330153 RepID=A0A7J6MSI9_PERCH|nr:hypothetical protein FOL47_009081 [Perkinsus chesapeaki]